MMRTRSGTTLAELLVVIAIVLTLGGLVLGAVGMVRAAALRAECLAHLRQVGMTLEAFVSDHGGRYPAEGNKGIDDPQRSWAWFHRLPPYVDQDAIGTRETIFQCPAYDFPGGRVFDAASPKSYKFNAWLDNAGRPDRYAQGSARDEARMVGFFDAVAGETGMGQWGHGTPSAVDAERHHGRVNVLHLDGHTTSTARGDAACDWEHELQWLDRRW